MIANVDALTFMAGLKARSVDFVFTDPPYGISRKSTFKEKGIKRLGISTQFGAWDIGCPVLLKDCAREWYRLLRPGGGAFVWYDLWKLESLSTVLKAAGFVQIRFVEWLKENPVPLNSQTNYLTNAREVAVFAVKGGKPTFKAKYHNGIYRAGIHHDGGERLHPTQKSIAITRQILEIHTRPGDVVLDCFAGSATHLIAAEQMGRKVLGCELDASYHQAATDRFMDNQPGFF
jgi:site-specific DNA-methyltransferase (adenine-specific)